LVLRTHVEDVQNAMRLAAAPRSPARRILLRYIAFLFALLLLQLMLSCMGPDFTVTTLDKGRMTRLRTFSIDTQPDPTLYIWDMRAIPFEELKPLVSDRLQEKGYQPASPMVADFRIILTAFTEEKTPRSRIAILEMFERSSSRKLWSGRAEIPFKINPKQGVTNHPALTGLLDLIPPRT
jgi:hypothetical protein